jgi:hypothetical protein
MAFDLPTVIDRRRAVTLGGERLASERLVAEISTQSLADVRAYIRQITEEVTAQQIALGNPPTALEVDNRTAKPLDAVQRQTVVVYGVTLARAAMREVETALAAAIMRSTTARSGRLSNVTGAWRWRLVRASGAVSVISAAAELPAFGYGDRLVLAPDEVPYATLVNRNVARSGRANVAPRKGKSPPKSRQNRGFLFHAADTLRRRPAFKQFHVRVVFTKAHMVPGELMTRTLGTGMLVISPRIRRVVRV